MDIEGLMINVYVTLSYRLENFESFELILKIIPNVNSLYFFYDKGLFK